DFDYRGVIEGLAEGGRVDRRGRDQNPELGSLVAQLAQVPEEEIDVQRTLVGFVDDERIVRAEQRIPLHFGEEHAVGEELDDGVAGRLVAETNRASPLPPPLHVQLLSGPTRNGERGDAAG